MTFEEIQQAIEGMLSVQRELQDSQLKLTEHQVQFESSLETLKVNLEESTKAFDRRFEQLIGYSINRECDALDTQQDILDLRHRVVAIERKLAES